MAMYHEATFSCPAHLLISAVPACAASGTAAGVPCGRRSSSCGHALPATQPPCGGPAARILRCRGARCERLRCHMPSSSCQLQASAVAVQQTSLVGMYKEYLDLFHSMRNDDTAAVDWCQLLWRGRFPSKHCAGRPKASRTPLQAASIPTLSCCAGTSRSQGTRCRPVASMCCATTWCTAGCAWCSAR